MRHMVILGAGPVGLVTAMVAARRGRVTVVSPRSATSSNLSRIDAVPISLLALFVEVGVHPAELDVSHVHDHRLVAWRSPDPIVVRGAAMVHVKRPLLERTLLMAAGRYPNINFATSIDLRSLPEATLVLDATGRRAISAEQRLAPDNPAVCRAFSQNGHYSAAQQAFRIAALPAGYAYRIGTATTVMVGLVQSRAEWQQAAPSIDGILRRYGADWLLCGLSNPSARSPARGGVASVQLSSGGSIQRVGDAAFARDALASQGIANGISSGLTVLDRPETAPGRPDGSLTDGGHHLKTLRGLIADCRYGDSEYWRSYSAFISRVGQRISQSGSADLLQQTAE